MADKASTEQRLQRALSQLMAQHASDSTPGKPTATALCRIAGVSRTTLYRYHPDIVRTLHKWQRKQRRRTAPGQQALTALREENAALRTQLGQLAALVDHYFAAWSESRTLLQRREGELAALRRRHRTKLASVPLESVPNTGK
ncbi:MAG: hypothetical protein OXI07_05345 [Gammaproteobacteria bacterium]|nr:hypothetical protein [Gammaproteobacteria bacterium]